MLALVVWKVSNFFLQFLKGKIHNISSDASKLAETLILNCLYTYKKYRQFYNYSTVIQALSVEEEGKYGCFVEKPFKKLDQKTFFCADCNKEFEREIYLQSHRSYLHENNVQEDINHKPFYHYTVSEDIISVTFRCQICPFSTEDDSEMISHHMETHTLPQKSEEDEYN